MDIHQTVRKFVLENFYVSDGDQLSNDASLVSLGIIDSSGVLELIAFVEEKFGVKVEERDTTPENLGSVNQIAAFVSRKLDEAKSGAA